MNANIPNIMPAIAQPLPSRSPVRGRKPIFSTTLPCSTVKTFLGACGFNLAISSSSVFNAPGVATSLPRGNRSCRRACGKGRQKRLGDHPPHQQRAGCLSQRLRPRGLICRGAAHASRAGRVHLRIERRERRVPRLLPAAGRRSAEDGAAVIKAGHDA